MIIGLNGRLKSGKDTTFGIIKELLEPEHRVVQVSFAKALKESAAASIGVSVVQLENWKNDEEVYFIRPDGTRFTAREYLQWYGTEGHRVPFGDNFWVNLALPKPTSPEGDWHPSVAYEKDVYVVTDMRFPNEAQQVLDLRGHTVKVVRETGTKFSAHASEQDIDHMIQYFLDNTTTLDDLRERTKFMLDYFFSKTDVYDARSLLFPAYATTAEIEDMRGWTE